MLYTECKQYLIDKLKAAGLKTKPYTARKTLSKSMESHVGAVLFQSENYSRNGSKRQFRDEEGARHKRKKVFDRALVFSVLIGDYSDEAVETMLEAFLTSLDSGIYVDGNFVPIEVEEGEWADSDDSLLKAKVAVQVAITFQGGVYKDTEYTSVSRVEITSEREN